MENYDVTKHIKFQRAVYKTLLHTLGWFYTLKSRFKYERHTPENETFLLVGNHNMNLDPFQAVIATRSHMRFVSNDAILKSFWGPVLKLFVGPIPRKRGASTDETVQLIKENLRAGISVAMYPESERSWDGVTEAISIKTAQLAKESGAALVTFATNGSYLRTPHWARNTRSGPTLGRVVNEYSPKQLEEMSVEEIYEAIVEDIHVNAFEFQRQHMYKYRGRDMAENAEIVCYICPKCKKIGKMYSEGDLLMCSGCGYTLRYNQYGFFEGENVVFDNTADWSRWQKEWLKENAGELKARTKRPIIVNEGVKLYESDEQGNMRELASGVSALLYGDRIDIVRGRDYTYKENIIKSFPMEQITKLGGFGKHIITLTCSGTYYKIKSPENLISIYIYFGMWRVLSGRDYY